MLATAALAAEVETKDAKRNLLNFGGGGFGPGGFGGGGLSVSQAQAQAQAQSQSRKLADTQQVSVAAKRFQQVTGMPTLVIECDLSVL